MQSSSHQHPSSYRDPSGFLFYLDGSLYRQVNQVFRKDFDRFVNGGLYQQLVQKDFLVLHETIDANLLGSADWYQTLKPETLNFVSYPYEWCFDMTRDAALLTLEIAKEAMRFGMMLKDASAYNIQLHKGRMRFIDTLSFEEYDEQKPWIAYRQFCEQFFAPLALMHYLKEPLQSLLLAFPEGIPLPLAKKMLPLKSRFRLSSYLHLHLHASLSKTTSLKNETNKPFSKQKMQNLLQSLEDGIRSFSFSDHSGVWSGYYEEALQRKDYITTKKEIILNWVSSLPVHSVLDAGANEGEFSELLHQKAGYIISADFDHYSINKLYKRIKEENISNIHPLIVDLSNPTPAIGVNNRERTEFTGRIKPDLVMALALIHHLAIGKNIPLRNIADMFYSMGSFLIIEFVPKEDEKIQLMLQQKKDIYESYNQENFLAAFSERFSLVDGKDISGSNRSLYLFQKR